MDVSCAGQVVARFSGFDLVVGRVVDGDQARSAFAAAALAFSVAGAAFAFVRHRLARGGAAAAAAMAAVSLLLLRFDIRRQLSAMDVTVGDAPAMTPGYRVGYWGALGFLAIAAVLNVALAFRADENDRKDPQ